MDGAVGGRHFIDGSGGPPMFRRILLAAAAVLMAGAFVLASRAPAQATDAPWGSPTPVPAAACATGSVASTTYLGRVDGTTTEYVRFVGSVAQCAPKVSDAQWGFIVYKSGYGLSRPVRTYPANSSFTYDFGSGEWSSYTAICLAYSPTGRLACYSVTTAGLDAPALAPIGLGDPRVLVPVQADPVRRTPPLPPTPPHCATCV